MIKNKRLRILMSIIFAFFSCLAIFSNKTVLITREWDFLNAIQCDVVCTTIVGCVLIFAFYKFFSKKFEKRILKTSLILAVIFSLCEVIGFYMDNHSAFFNISMNIYMIAFNVIVFLGYAFLLFPVMVLTVNYLTTKDVLGRFSSEKHYKYFSDNIHSVFSVACFLVIAWGIYYVIFFPGIVTWDAYYQIEQGLGFRVLNDDHPFIHTFIEGRIIKLGIWIFGNINLGIACCTFIQMVAIAVIVSLVIRYLARKNVPSKIRLIILLFYALHPVIAAYSVTLWKDVWMGVFVLIYIIFLFEICYVCSDFFKSKIKIILFIVSILCILFSKGTGIVIIVLSFPFCFIFARKQYKSLLLSIVVCFSVFFSIKYTVGNVFHIQSGHVREPLSVPIQQVARTVKYHKNDLKEDEYKIISEVLPIEEVGNLYEPKLSDNVKGELNEENFSKDKLKYASLWFKLGLKHPFTYLDSFLANSYGYWYPETIYWQVSSSSWIHMLDFYKSNNWTIHDENYANYNESHTLNMLKTLVKNSLDMGVRKLPIVNLFFSIGIFFWIDLICVAVAILKKKYSLIPIFAALGAVFLICVGSPVHAECRYAYPAILTLPIVILYTVANKGSCCTSDVKSE